MDQTIKRALTDLNASLQKTVTFADSIDINTDAVSDTDVKLLKTECNAAALTLNKLYLSTIVSAMGSAATEQRAKELKKDKLQREKDINEIISSNSGDIKDTIERIKAIFTPLVEDNQIRVNRKKNVDSHVQDYSNFVEALLRDKNLQTPPHSKSSLKKLIELYADQIDDQDNDFIYEETITAPKCAVTGKLVELPVRGPCGHFFSSEGLDIIFHDNTTRKCPLPGCSVHYSRADCYSDRLLELEAEVWKNKNNNENILETSTLEHV